MYVICFWNAGGKLIIDDTCQLEIEWDGATTTMPGEQSGTLNNGILDLNAGGELVNNGIITIEGTEGKPIQPGTTPSTNKGWGELTVEAGATLTNNGAMLVYGRLYNLGTLVNNGNYEDLITSNDPDKGTFSYHRGIQIAWKDDVTQENVRKGELFNGTDSAGGIYTDALLQNNGDIVLRPGQLTNYATIHNAKGEGNIYLAAAPDAIIPIEPDPANPTVVTKRIALDPPVASTVVNYGLIVNGSGLLPASVELLDNAGFGKLEVPGDGEATFELFSYGEIVEERDPVPEPDDPDDPDSDDSSKDSDSQRKGSAASTLPATGDASAPWLLLAIEALGAATAAAVAALRIRL